MPEKNKSQKLNKPLKNKNPNLRKRFIGLRWGRDQKKKFRQSCKVNGMAFEGGFYQEARH